MFQRVLRAILAGFTWPFFQGFQEANYQIWGKPALFLIMTGFHVSEGPGEWGVGNYLVVGGRVDDHGPDFLNSCRCLTSLSSLSLASIAA